MTDHKQAAMEAGAKAMADDWNPGRDPILTAMFRDYSASAIEAALPRIRAMIAQEIETYRAKNGPIDSLYLDGRNVGLITAAQIAKGLQQ